MTRLPTCAALALTLGLLPLAAAEVPLGDDGLHKPAWLKDSFKVLAEDNAEAAAAGRHLMLIVEQRGCIYCQRLHTEVLADLQVEGLIRSHFDVIQIDLFGATGITDLDGEVLSEKRAAGKWGVTVTPSLLILPQDPPDGADAARAALALVPGVLDGRDMIALLDWARAGGEPGTGRPLGDVIGQ